MLNFITQQRRGSTEEWARSTVIPRAGEFVIEERKDAPIRIKIGDGIHQFNDLKYIDEATVTALTELEARYNAHVAYIEGGSPVPDSTLATEVLDARYIDGTSHSSLNAAIQSVSDKRIGGMVYDYTGEVGNRQPYMLYLTDKDNNILEETGVRIISGSGGGGGGGTSTNVLKIGYITTSPLIVTPKDKALLKFTFSGEDSSGDAILQASSTWKVDGKTVSYGTVKSGANEFDVTKYLKLGTSKVLLTVIDDAGSVVTKTWSVQQVDVRIESNFNDKLTYPVEDLIFDFIPHGAVDKTVKVLLDGKLLTTIDSPAKMSGNITRCEIPAQAHGSHLLDIYMEAKINDNTITSNHIYKDILFYDASVGVPVIGTTSQEFTAYQYSTTNIEYTVYDPSTETPEVTITVDGKVVSQVTLTEPTNTFAYNTSEVKTHTIVITCNGVDKVLTAHIEKLDIDLNPVTVGLAFDFNPIGRSNSDNNRLWTDGDVSMSVSDNFDWVNGGYKQDSNGETYFCVKSGTTATIDYKLFGDDAKKTGKEVKLVFKTTNVANPDAKFLTCVDNSTATDHVGLEMGVHNANIYAQNGHVDLSYSENDVIEFEFNISSATEAVPMIMGYEDGVSTRPMVYDDSFSFKQNTPKNIVIGSPDCDVHIYRFKVYSTSLSDIDILNNYIADARSTTEILSRYDRNQIYDENKMLTPEVLAEKCPWLRVYKLSAPHFTNNKSDKVSDTVIQQIYKDGDPILDNWVAYNAQHSGQGTSSNNYGAAGRNLDFIMNKSNSYIELGDGTIANSITLTRNSVPVAYLNAKVNIASSNNLTNAILANRYNRFNPYRRPFVRDEGVNIDNIKDTMEFHNCVIFIQETDPDLSTHREFADTDWHFYAIGNIGDSKKTDKTRKTDINDDYECCVEIMDVGLPLSGFPVDTMIDAMGYTVDEVTEEKTYIWATDDNLNILYEKQADGSYVLTQDTTVNYEKTYYVDILEHDDFSEDYTYGWRYISDDENSQIVDYCKQKWIDFYRFVTRSTDAEFKEHFDKYFVKDSALYYYLFTTRYCMVDNRAKNTFWHYSKTGGTYTEDIEIRNANGDILFAASAGEEIRKWDLCWDYDNDTSLGLNNYGKQVYRYGLEDMDKDANNIEVFRQSDSMFFCRVRDLFAPELKAMYKTLESQNAWHAESFLNECDEWQSQFPEELWRIDIERKYIRTYTSSFINGKGDAQFLVNMANGKMKYHRRQWERSQEQYMASKYQTTTASGDSAHANLRATRPDVSNPDLAPNYTLTLTPYSYMYLNVQYGSKTPVSIRAVPNQPTVVPTTETAADIINIFSAASIRDFGDLSLCYPTTVTMGNASRLKKLTLGNSNADYVNNALTELKFDANDLLEELNIENINSLTGSVDLRKLLNLKTLKAFGTSINNITFAAGGKLSYVELPAVNTLKLDNLLYLTSDNLKLTSYDNIVELVVEGCPQIDALELLDKCTNARRIRLLDLDIDDMSYSEFANTFFHLKGVNTNGEETPNAWLTGKVKFTALTGTEYTELRTRYPFLEVEYELLTCTLRFYASDLTTLVHEQIIYNEGDCVDPVSTGIVELPTKNQTISTTYTYSGWSTLTDNVTVTPSPLLSVSDDMDLYPTFDEHVRLYTVQFVNNDNSLINSYQVGYGTEEFIYPAAAPLKAGVTDPTAYKFNQWIPEPKNITGDLTCYATYVINEEHIYNLQLSDFTYSIVQDELFITEYTNSDKKLIRVLDSYTIDETTYPVTYISGFRDKSLEYVILPDSLKIIDQYAFAENRKLTTINIPKNVETIGLGACYFCSGLETVYYDAVNATVNTTENNRQSVFATTASILGYTVYIGADVETIPAYVFTQSSSSRIYGAKTIIFAEGSKCKTIAANAFTRNFTVDVTLPETLTYIGANAFSYCDITHLDIPEGVTTIGSDAFSNCPYLQMLTIPETVTSLSGASFRYSPNIEFTIAEGSKYKWINHCLVDLNAKTLVFASKNAIIPDNIGLKLIGQHAFEEVDVETVIVPEGVTQLEQYAFYKCPNLTTLILPESLVRIDSFAIYGSPMPELLIPRNVQDISTFALVDKTELTTITFPRGLTSLGFKVLRGCKKLESVYINSATLRIAKPTEESYNLFGGTPNLTYVQVSWNSDGTAPESTSNFTAINNDAPWGAGTSDDNGTHRVVPVTVAYADKTLVYNIDGTINEVEKEQGE